jgi:hypothetical protein
MRPFDSGQLTEFRTQLESQSPRQLRRFLDYGKRLKRGDAPDEFFQWLGKILLDDKVYDFSERAMAFEIGAGERVVELWGQLETARPVHLFIAEPVDRLSIYQGIIDEVAPWEHRAAFWRLLSERYGKHWSWIEEIRSARDRVDTDFLTSSGGRLFAEFTLRIQEANPSTRDVFSGDRTELAKAEEQVQRDAQTIKALVGDLEFAEDRAQRAHGRLKIQDEEIHRLRRQVAEERENGEKLRSERRTRIYSQRQSNQSQKDLEHLRREYVKLDARLQDMAKRLALSEQLRLQEARQWDLEFIRQLSVHQLLGLEGDALSAEELGQIRRRFAGVLHPDRMRGLPPWVTSLFAEIMGIINEACDRVK